jgi:hypothetical protein
MATPGGWASQLWELWGVWAAGGGAALHDTQLCPPPPAPTPSKTPTPLLPTLRGDILETGYTQLYHGSSGQPLNLTLEGQLLHQTSSGSPHYDALFLEHMPPVEELLTSLAGSGPRITLLVNQSAISGLPAALNQASSALLRLIVAAGGAKGSPASAPAPAPAAAAATSAAHQPLLASADGGSSSSSSSLGDPAAGGSSAGGVLPGGGHLPSCVPVIRAVSSPLPLMRGEQAQRIRQDAGALMLVLCMTLAVSVLSASFVVFLVRWVSARVLGRRTQQASGLLTC